MSVEGTKAMKIVVAGGTGFLGKSLVSRLLQQGHTVIVLTRSSRKASFWSGNLRAEQWDAVTVGSWVGVVDGADAIINLTGELIAGKRWTRRQKDRILKSRVDSTRVLVSAIEQVQHRPSVLINISAVGFYGDVSQGDVTEEAPKGNGFLAGVCSQWESEALAAQKLGVRVVTPRLGVVLGVEGGALTKLMAPFKFFAGGYLGSGKQWFPWIHIKDVVNALLFLLNHPSMVGPVNLAAPQPLTMKEFTNILGKIMHRPAWTAVPSFVLRLALGEMAEMLLTGQRVVPRKLLDAEFVFEYATARTALTAIINRET
jgi:uncharacterized protein (TIGR01777 family)